MARLNVSEASEGYHFWHPRMPQSQQQQLQQQIPHRVARADDDYEDDEDEGLFMKGE